MLSLEVIKHENVAPGSFPIAIHFDLTDEYFVKSGWHGYLDAAEAMSEWCRERWGAPTGETGLRSSLWMNIGKRFFVRTDAQAIEFKMRWHRATP